MFVKKQHEQGKPMLNKIKLLMFFVDFFSRNSRTAILGINARVTDETNIKSKYKIL